MATVSTREIKTRIRSMASTRQITKAMEMVAASKLRHAQARVASSRPYFEVLRQAMSEIARSGSDFSSAYFEQRPVQRTVYVVIAGDRGLAGGYNSNILKLLDAHMENKNAAVLPIGRKAVEYCKSRRLELLTESYADAAGLTVGDCFSIAKLLSKAYLQGEFDELYFGYTNFNSVLSQVPSMLQILPLSPEEETDESRDVLYEPDSTTVFEAIVPEYLGGVLYGALCESRASEQAARRTAMDAATQNADEMIGQLQLKFNQARQAAITQEITEIVAGS